MNVYPILESELDSMGMLSLQVEGSLTLAGVFASAWFTLGLENQLSPEASPAGQVLLTTGPWVCGALTLAFGSFGIIAWIKRGNNIRRIKRESRQRAIVVQEQSQTRGSEFEGS